MKPRLPLLAAGILLAAFVNGLGQSANLSDQSAEGLWRVADRTEAGNIRPQRAVPLSNLRAFSLNHAALARALAQTPKEFTALAWRHPAGLTLPMPDGSFARFRIVESPIMEPALAAKFPEIKTYSGQGLDDPSATVRFDVTPEGLHAQVLSPQGAFHVEPCSEDSPDLHASYYLRDAMAAEHRFECLTTPAAAQVAPRASQLLLGELARSPQPLAGTEGMGQMLRIYRLAVAADGEYTSLHGGTVAGAMASIVSLVNRLNGLYEGELAIRFVLVADNDLVVYADPETDPYLPMSTDRSAERNQHVLDTVIGTANYDIGHLFSGRHRGGYADGRVCDSGSKGRGASESPYPQEPLFQLQMVAHEMGHQFGAGHSWNGTGGLCGPDEHDDASAYEPGSGSTIMAYAGFCGGADNLQRMHDLYFHSGTLDEINNYVNGAGASCRVLQPTGNTPPTVSAGPNYVIPAGTPFSLTATGSDPDGDPLTYCWEQRDLGPIQPATGLGSQDNGHSPLFRSFRPTKSPTRTFPRLADILNHSATIGEQLPTRGRIMHFRVTARDNRAGGGGVRGADMQLTVANNAGPFVVTSPAGGAIWSGIQTVTWNVAGTAGAPILAKEVNILLSTNGGLDFPMTLAVNTPNDGTESVNLPDLYTTAARIKVEAAGNIFFAISNPDFVIVPIAPVVLATGVSLVAEGCPPTNGVIDPGERVTIQSVFQNIGAADTARLVVTLLATGGVLAPDAPQTNGIVSANGGRVTNSFAFLADPAIPCGGTLVTSFRLQDGPDELGTVTVPLSLGRTTLATSSFANTNPIVIPVGGGPGIPDPSSIGVAGLQDSVSKVTVTLRNVTHPRAWAVDVLLVGPAGQTVMLMSDIGLSPLANLTFTFDDEAALSLLEATQVVSGAYRPANAEAFADEFLPPAPPGPYGSSLSVFNGSDPNGTWKLLVRDPESGMVGRTIAGGWSLAITTAHIDCCRSPDLSLSMADSPDPVTVGANLTYTLTVTNVSLAEATGVIVSDALPPGVALVSAESSQGTCAGVGGRVTCNLGTLAAGASVTVTLEVTPDAVGMIANTARVTHDGTGVDPSGTATTLLTTVNPVPRLSIASAAVSEGNLGVINLIFPVSLSVASAQPVAVHYETSDGSAVAGIDYLATNGVVTFNPGETFKTISVPVLGDTLCESNKTLLVSLSAAVNGSLEVGSAPGTIIDDDFVALSVVGVSVTEGDEGTTNAVFSVRLSAISGATVNASYYTLNSTARAGTDYVLTSGNLSFPPGTTNQTITVPVLGDLQNELSETFQLQLVHASYATLPGSAATGTILNDDALPTLSINDAGGVEGDAGTSLTLFTLSLSSASSRFVRVNYATANGTALAGVDYVSASGSVSFPPGTTNLSIAIPVNGDVVAETNEVFFVNLSSPVNATIAKGQGVGTIRNDDPRILTAEKFGNDVLLRFSGIPGQPCSLERALAVTGPWTTLNTQIAPASGLLEHLDVTSVPGSAFYRTVQP